MKVVARSIIAVLTILMFAHHAASLSSTIVGDVIIQSQNGTIYCDSMICPPEAVSCQVTKRNDPYDFSQIIKKRKCFDRNGAIIAQETITEPNYYQGNVNISIISGGGGTNTVRELTPEEREELDVTLRRTHQQVADTLRGVDESLRPFRDGSFSANLRNRIDAQIRDSFNNALRF